MAKGKNLQKSIEIMLGVSAHDLNQDSKALKRVKAYGKDEGIYLTKAQLEQILHTNSHVDGIWFAIGITENSSKNTVELLPIKLSSGKIKILKKGHLNVNASIDSILDNDINARFKDSHIIEPIADFGPTIPSQRTPPPRPE